MPAMRDDVVGQRRCDDPLLISSDATQDVALTHHGDLVVGPHATQGVPETEGFGRAIPALGVPTGVRGEAGFSRPHQRMCAFLLM